MTRIIAICSCALLLGACGTSYKVAPSTTKIATKVATARRSVQHSQSLTKSLEATTQQTQTDAATTAQHIDAALSAITTKDYVTAAQALIRAKASNELVESMLRQSLRNVTSLGMSLQSTERDLGEAEGDIRELNKTIEAMAIQGAKDRAIVEQVNWGFGLGAFIYGIKRILTFGFFGVIGLVIIIIVMLVVGGPAALYAMRAVRWILGLFKKRKSG